MSLRIANRIGIIGLKVALLTSLVAASVAILVGTFVYDAAIDELIDHERVDLRDETALRAQELRNEIEMLRADTLLLAARVAESDALAGIVQAHAEDGLADEEASERVDAHRHELENMFIALCRNKRVEHKGQRPATRVEIEEDAGDAADVGDPSDANDAEPTTAAVETGAESSEKPTSDGRTSTTAGMENAPPNRRVDQARPYFQVRLIQVSDDPQRHGREMVRVVRGGSPHSFAPVGLEELDTGPEYWRGDRDYFTEATRLLPHEVHLSEIDLNREEGETGHNAGLPTLRAAVPIRGPDGEVFGVLVINMDFGHVIDKVLTSARHLTWLFNREGDFLVHPEPRYEFAFDKPASAGGESFNISSEVDLYQELERFVHAPPDSETAREARAGYNLDPSQIHNGRDVGVIPFGYRFQLLRLELAGEWSNSDWNSYKEKLSALRMQYRGVVEMPDAERLPFGNRVLTISAPISNSEAMTALEEVQSELNRWVADEFPDSDKSIEEVYEEPCRSFYASFVRVDGFDPEHSDRYLGLVMAFSQDEMYADLWDTKFWATASGVAFVLLAMGVAFLFSYMLTRRLNQVTGASESIAAGDFSVALPTESRDEIGDLARGFQHMIQELRSREQKIEASEVRLRMIVDGAAEGIITIDREGRIRSTNAAATRMFGREHKSSVTRFQELLNESCREEFEFTLKRLLVDGASSTELPTLDDDSSTFRQLLKNRGARTESLFLESVGRRPDGEEFPIELSLSTVRLPDQRIVTLITRDITQRKLDEEQIQQLNEELELRNVNLEQGVRERTAELENAMLELREARDKAQELAKAKDAFLASVSHELRNPLNQVSGFCQLLELSELDGEQQEDVRKIRVANDQLLALINDILDYQKIIMGGLTLEPQSLNVEHLVGEVRDAMSVLPNPNRNQFYVEWSDDVGNVYADKQRLRQVLLNLVGNAWKFTREGSVHFSAARRHAETGDWIEFSVQDTGRGMTPEEQERLFRPFTKLASRKGNESGTGLGLVISKGLCTLMRGDITLNSEFGKGSCFIIRLPASASDSIPGLDASTPLPETIAREIDEDESDPVPAAVATAARPRTQRGEDVDHGRLVLVIDDDPAVCEMMQRHLKSHGFEVVTAGSGFEGLELARKLKPAVITLDAVMPGLDGWAVLGALKAGEDTSSIPVIMVTVMDKEERSRALGATEFLPKPIDWEQLTTTLSQYTGDKRDRSILIVDDDVNTREIIRRSLESDGWAVMEAENGKQALERLADERPAAVLLDLMMPIMDGFEFIVNYSQVAEWLSIPVLVLTAKDPTPEERERLEGQVVRVLRKGDYTHDELLVEIHRRVDRHLKHQLASQGDEDGADSGR